jgi:hypothetical protein
VRADAGVVAGLAGAVADGVPDGEGAAGWLPQAARVTGITAIASANPAAVVSTDFMTASSARTAELAALHLLSSLGIGRWAG